MVQISLNDIQLPDITHINYVFTQFTKIKTNSAHLKIHSIVDKTFLLERLIFRGALKLLVSGEFPASCQFFKKLTFSPCHWNPDPKILVAQAMNPLWKTRCHRPTVTGDLGMFFSWKRVASGGPPKLRFGMTGGPQKDTIQTPENLRRYSPGMSRGSFWRRL